MFSGYSGFVFSLTDCFFYPILTDAIDKGDNRRLCKKPVFTSSQVILFESNKQTFVLRMVTDLDI